MMRTLITVNLGRDPLGEDVVEFHRYAAAAADLLDVSEWIEEYAVEHSEAEEVLVLFDTDLPDVTRVMTSAWHLVRGTAFEGVELIISGTHGRESLRATFGTIPVPAPGAWPESAEDVDEFNQAFEDWPEDTLMMC